MNTETDALRSPGSLTQVLYPAIDLRQGSVVRLEQGDPARQTVFDDDPMAVARGWAAAGASWLHVVNLDGAFADEGAANWSLLPALARLGVNIQFGGGIRSLADVEWALAAGVQRVVLGTVAVEQPALVADAVSRYGAEHVAVSLDARDGLVRTRGWRQDAGITAVELGRRMADHGVGLVVHTDISRDGLMGGANVAASASLARETGLAVVVSGGVASLDDVRAVRGVSGLAGIIIGRALYDGAVDLADALAVLAA